MKATLIYYPIKGIPKPVELQWELCAVAGYTGRDKEHVMRHIEEMKAMGISTPSTVPEIYWIEPSRITLSDTVYSIGKFTSGEVEVFIGRSKNREAYVTVASDHTDRELEKISTSKAKQICSKIIGNQCWKMNEIREHWDELILESFVKTGESSSYSLYQKGKLSEILPPEELESIASKQNPLPNSTYAMLCGTVPLLSGKTVFAGSYLISLYDPVFRRTLTHTYRVRMLPDKK